MNQHPYFAGPMLMEPDVLSRLLSLDPDAAGPAPAASGSGRVLSVNGALAVLAVNGPLAAQDSLFLRLVGGTALSEIAASLDAALANREVQRVVLAIDSPGGQVAGVSELADSINQARRRKPITAYVSGMGASAAYWLAAAAGRIVLADTALVGSIGVAAVVYDDRAYLERNGIARHEIVSSQSPHKRPDVATDAGRAQIQANIDSLAGIFVAKVAQYRGVSTETVLSKFGRGGLLVGAEAVRAGLADAVGHFEAASSAPTITAGDSLESQWAADPALRSEFCTFETYRAYAAADAAGRVSIHKSGVIHHGRF
jgi:signal peptide peptidase SppA